MESGAYQQAIAKLRNQVPRYGDNALIRDIIQARDQVLATFQPVFSPEHLPRLTEDEFRGFLPFERNRHWGGLQRQAPAIVSDMPKLRNALTVLIGKERPIAERMDYAINTVSGMGRALASAILLIRSPDSYGVWNSTSEGALKELRIWPQFERGATLGARYAVLNELLLKIASDLGTDLWSLDAYWYAMATEAAPADELPPLEAVKQAETTQGFGLEKHLHEFLRDNWNSLALAQEWVIYAEQGDPVGYEYPTAVGRIDLLCRHRREPRWLVIELKRGQTSDATVGQVLRYIGWLKTEMAEANEEVKGLVIAHDADDALRYALRTVPNVDLQLYEVEFHLRPAQES